MHSSDQNGQRLVDMGEITQRNQNADRLLRVGIDHRIAGQQQLVVHPRQFAHHAFFRHHPQSQLANLMPGFRRHLVAVQCTAPVIKQLQLVADQDFFLVVQERTQIGFTPVGIADRRPDEGALRNGTDRLLMRFYPGLGLRHEQLQSLAICLFLRARYGAQAE